ncbi:protein FLC EXPRESSOR [Mercurialis annua]|uniref:protein FLC EXPRESSOR n=1 Tax=Mercurialis annua TaxID=3986 RepID=UPI00215E8C20|nr:protein FLC EXPRESSOR [Mercurialis annua]XP_050219926.1 protein FLC EXPRESSOR [Mercurialis annua]
MGGHNRPNSSKFPLIINHQTTILEDRIAIQRREIQTLLRDNQHLATNHLALKQDLSFIQDEIRRLKAAAANVKAERDDQVREVYERSLKLDSEVRSIDALRGELAQVRADVEKLSVHRQELATDLRVISSDVAKAKMEKEQIIEVKNEIKIMQMEIQSGRAAIEYEKKLYASNLEHGQKMEQNMVAIAREIENLHVELANAGKRASTEGPGYAGSYNNPELLHGGNGVP